MEVHCLRASHVRGVTLHVLPLSFRYIPSTALLARQSPAGRSLRTVLLLPLVLAFSCARRHSMVGSAKDMVCRVLGGNDKETCVAIAQRYEEKYDVPLVEALKDDLEGERRRGLILVTREIIRPKMLATPTKPPSSRAAFRG